MRRRVVITGMGIVCPGAHGLGEFEALLRSSRSAIRKIESLSRHGFACQVGGLPDGIDEKKRAYFTDEALFAMNSHMVYGGIAGIDCWKDAGLAVPAWNDPAVDWETGAILGTGSGGTESLVLHDYQAKVAGGNLRRLGGSMVEQTMMSAASAKLAGLLALGGHVGTNSTACATSTESIVEGFFHVASGRFRRMLVGGTEGGTEASAPFAWAGFDAMRVLSRGWNATPELASRPLSERASGFVPAAGAGVLLLETLESARERGAKVYAEVLGAHANSGGQRGDGSMTAANSEGVVRCVREAVRSSGIGPEEIDAINGHLTATAFDAAELRNWQRALERKPGAFPWIQATKSFVGHGLGAAGAWECIACVIQLHKRFLHASLNCEDTHPELSAFEPWIVREGRGTEPSVFAKASFGFGDVNACVVFKRWSEL